MSKKIFMGLCIAGAVFSFLKNAECVKMEGAEILSDGRIAVPGRVVETPEQERWADKSYHLFWDTLSEAQHFHEKVKRGEKSLEEEKGAYMAALAEHLDFLKAENYKELSEGDKEHFQTVINGIQALRRRLGDLERGTLYSSSEIQACEAAREAYIAGYEAFMGELGL